MRAKLVRIGNSRGVRLPKALIQQAELGEEVELELRDGEIVIKRARRPREGWAEAAAEMAARGEDKLLDPYVPTRFDLEEWEW
ncbi:MAG: AbrB/MazE/SpoVT family DNA-binding domain-containing protein [Actinomycetota bacterium]